MNTLILVSTKAEISPIIQELKLKTKQDFFVISKQCDCLISGVGLLSTAFSLTKILNFKTYERIVQIGVAGSFNPELKLGNVVEVISEQAGDLGAENASGEFLTLKDLLLQNDNLLNDGKITTKASFSKLQSVSAISVNTVSGTVETIKKRKQLFGSDIETMEGLALFYVCSKLKIPFAQVRSISNFIEPRNRDNWDLELAIKNVNSWLQKNIL